MALWKSYGIYDKTTETSAGRAERLNKFVMLPNGIATQFSETRGIDLRVDSIKYHILK